jgi:hypothetical protein
MARPVASCPNCSAPVTFRWSSAVQTVCVHCRSILVRRDVDLTRVGEVADLPGDWSPVRLGTTGRFEGDRFTVTGRIVYEYEHGTWNEWHLAFDDDASGWLSDAQAEYAISRRLDQPESIPGATAIRPGQTYRWNDVALQVTTLTRARYRGVEGELPFEYWNKSEVLFADLRSADGHFATVDYSESSPLVFVGRFVGFDELELRGLREDQVATTAEAEGFNCRNCAAPITLRAGPLAETVACSSCGAIQSPSDPNLLILQEAERRLTMTPTIPLGARGRFDGHEYDVIGFQYRSITVEGEEYGWREYLLFNRERGFRYLSEYAGHWNDIQTLRAVPVGGRRFGHQVATVGDQRFKHFQSARATTRFVLGEFPWQVRAGDVVDVSDYVAPPRLLSAERTEGETTWSIGDYTPGSAVWTAFGLEGKPPRARGIFANQPSPYHGRLGSYWRTFAVLALLVLLVYTVRSVVASREPVYSQRFAFTPGTGEASFVTPVFELGGRESNVEVRIDTDLRNNWTYFNLALIDAESGTALDFGEEVSYYFGRDSDGDWTEGSPVEDVTVPTVPPGRYYLRVEPEGSPNSKQVTYTVTVRRDVPAARFYWMALGLMVIPPVFATFRAISFESRRWHESDYGE